VKSSYSWLNFFEPRLAPVLPTKAESKVLWTRAKFQIKLARKGKIDKSYKIIASINLTVRNNKKMGSGSENNLFDIFL
jgi:hypothetical protein